VRLVPVEKLTFPDQQQDLQNAAEFSLASECDGSVKSARQAEEADSGAIRMPDGVWVGGCVSDVENSLCDHLLNARIRQAQVPAGNQRAYCGSFMTVPPSRTRTT